MSRAQWGVLVAGIVSIIAAGSYTTLAGLLTTSFVEQVGWRVDTVGPGIALNMIFYGLAAPFAIYLMRSRGVLKIANAALAMLVAGSMIALIPMPVLFNLVWGFVIGIGTGCLTMAYGSLLVRIWFPERPGLISGYLVAASVFGQFALLPFWSEVMQLFGWRAPLIGSALISLLAIAVNMKFLRPAVSEGEGRTPAARNGKPRFHDEIVRGLLLATRSYIFWILVVLFLICGATTNGIMWSHFTMAATVCGLSVTAASSVLLLIGLFNVAGTTVSGWLTDRISVRLILAVAFTVRALTLLWLPSILVGVFDERIITFGIVFGIMDVATVPPVIAICNRVYGDDGPSVFGWVNAFHQLGAGAMALSGSLMWRLFGNYDPLWYTSGALCLGAAIFVFASSYRPRDTVHS